VTDLLRLLAVATEAVALARDIVLSRKPGIVTAKRDRDMASEVDYAVEQTLRKVLADRTPEIGFLGEEEGRSAGRPCGQTSVEPDLL
jgi:myo-inositol-1(or 4)-monophosphatase